jgi:hypothetical protein
MAIKLCKKDGRWHAAIIVSAETQIEALEALALEAHESSEWLRDSCVEPDSEPDVSELTEWQDYDPDC